MPIETPRHQNGAALVTAMLFLIVITLLSITGMRSSTLELRMASNEESRVQALENAQAAVDAVVNNLNNFPVAGTAGYTICANTTGCNASAATDLTAAPFDAAENTVVITRVGSDSLPPPRGLETSATAVSVSIFTIDSTVDRSASAGGRVRLVQGLARLVPQN